ncbi:MAG: hypothetical protein FJ098_15210, partial [Deltaproteobacteria bacterium]|nr:hypothetical protein [Deltaproteobacteria bacterium]
AYRDPRQDLDGLWWSLVERWQGIGRPPGRRAPDWASKIHLSLFPVYYQNYLLGQLFAWQLRTALEGEPGLEWHRRPEVARHLSEELFAHGASRAWPEAVRLLTGAALGPGALCDALRCSGRDAAEEGG